MSVLAALDLFARSYASVLTSAERRSTEVQAFARAARALRRDLADRDAAGTERARTDLNARALRSADALAAAAGRLAQANDRVAALVYDLAFTGTSESQHIRYLASAESREGWLALAQVEGRLARAYAAPAQIMARLAAQTTGAQP